MTYKAVLGLVLGPKMNKILEKSSNNSRYFTGLLGQYSPLLRIPASTVNYLTVTKGLPKVSALHEVIPEVKVREW